MLFADVSNEQLVPLFQLPNANEVDAVWSSILGYIEFIVFGDVARLLGKVLFKTSEPAHSQLSSGFLGAWSVGEQHGRSNANYGHAPSNRKGPHSQSSLRV